MKRIFKVLIIDSNRIFSTGLQSYIEEYFSQRNIPVFILSVPYAYPIADMIFWAPDSPETSLPLGLIREAPYMKKLVMVMSEKNHHLSRYNIPSVFYRHQGKEILRQLLDNIVAAEKKACETPCTPSGNIVLTSRQEQVLYFLSRGMGINEISSLLRINGKTVSCHKRSAMARLNLPRSTDLYQWLIGNAMTKIVGKSHQV